MAKILLFVIEDMAGPGIRALGSYLKENGHQPVLVFIGSTFFRLSNKLPDSIKIGYDNLFAGIIQFKFIEENKQIHSLPSSFITLCKHENPDIIGFSTRFIEDRFKGFFSVLKENFPDKLLIAGGHGPSVHTEDFLDMDLDCVVRGEGEDALLELANCMDAGEKYSDIQNIALKINGEYIVNPVRPPIANLDDYPLPLRQAEGMYHIDDNIVYKGDYKYSSDAFFNLMLAGRGCIGSCSYCAAPLWRQVYSDENYFVPKHRRRSNRMLIEEAVAMKKDGAGSILFMDDFFIRPYEEMLDFFNQWKTKVGVPFFIHFSVEQLKKHPDLLEIAINSGLSALDLALQSGDEKFCKDIFHRINDNKAILRFFWQAHDNYLPIYAEFIDGYLIEGRDDLASKLDFISKLPFDPAYMYGTMLSVLQLRIHPGSPLSSIWPNLHAKLLSQKEFIYRAMLMHFRLILNDEEFALLENRDDYKNDPFPMYQDFLYKFKLLQLKNILVNAKRLKNRKVYFFGCGYVYQQYKHLFKKCHSEGILVDIPAEELFVDGLPVLQLEKILAGGEKIPIIIFSGAALLIARKIKALRPDYTRDDIIACEGYYQFSNA